MKPEYKAVTLALVLTMLIMLVAAVSVGAAPDVAPKGPEAKFSTAVAFDQTPPLRDLAAGASIPASLSG